MQPCAIRKARNSNEEILKKLILKEYAMSSQYISLEMPQNLKNRRNNENNTIFR